MKKNQLKSTYRYNWEGMEWDYVIHDFMVRGVTLVITPSDPYYPAKASSNKYMQAQRKRNFEMARNTEMAALGIQAYR